MFAKTPHVAIVALEMTLIEHPNDRIPLKVKARAESSSVPNAIRLAVHRAFKDLSVQRKGPAYICMSIKVLSRGVIDGEFNVSELTGF